MRLLLTILLLMAGTFTSMAQRHITPVTSPEATPISPKRDDSRLNLREVVDDAGRIVLVDTVTGTEFVDTTAMRIPRMEYPLWQGLIVDVNVFDALMRAFGQRYGLADVGVSLSLHNRYFPTVEVGLGMMDDTPPDNNYTYRTPIAPYFKIGADYNFFYNNSPDYRLMAGVRYGFSSFSYSVDNVLIDNGYWGEDPTISIPRQTASAGYLDILLRVRVKVWKGFSMGWAFKFHTILHEGGKALNGQPIYIPGYGKRNSSITAGLTLSYTFSLNKPRPESVAQENSEQ